MLKQLDRRETRETDNLMDLLQECGFAIELEGDETLSEIREAIQHMQATDLRWHRRNFALRLERLYG